MDVLILAAGLGTRMEDLTRDLPKPLLPVKGKPLIDYAFDLIKPLQTENIYVNTHYHADLVQSHIRISLSVKKALQSPLVKLRVLIPQV